MRAFRLLLCAALLPACGDDVAYEPATVPPGLLAGYTMTQLRFDPQGSIPDIDLRARLEGTLPQLVIARNARAQLVFTDPETGLVTISNAEYEVLRDDRVRITFDDGSPLFRRIMLSERMSFTWDPNGGTLVFSDRSPDGVPRQRLLQLAPELAGEQLFDPVPGQLTVVFESN